MSDLNLVDRILSLSDDDVVARKNLTINEDYLLDHFADYPVMPGVLMIQSVIETAGWWVKYKTGFEAFNINLRGVRNVRFANFLRPGETLKIEVKNKFFDSKEAKFQGKGFSEEKVVLSLQFSLNYSLICKSEGRTKSDEYIKDQREQFDLLFHKQVAGDT